MAYLQYNFQPVTTVQKELLTAMLADVGFEGFEEGEDILCGFIREFEKNEERVDEIVEQLCVTYSVSVVADQNWNAVWEAGFQPVLVNDPVSGLPFASIRAAFHAADPAALYDLVITPKMAFGTGHHATTFLVIQEMSRLDISGNTVIDFGTGTGVLAVLATKLGAASVTAIDCDEWSINNAKENFSANDCNNVNLIQTESFPGRLQADVILANINLNILLANMALMASALCAGGHVIFSGILLHDLPAMKASIATAGLQLVHWHEKDHWLCLYVVK